MGTIFANPSPTKDEHWQNYPPSENDYSVVLKITLGKFEYFTGGDATGTNADRSFPDGHVQSYNDVESTFADKVENIEVLRVNHHGSAYSTNERLLSRLNPEFCVISSGKNTYRHPDKKVVQRLRDTCRVFVTTDVSTEEWQDDDSIKDEIGLQTALRQAGEDLSAVQKTVERWYEDLMDRVTGWYKRKLMIVTTVVAVVVTVSTNADTIAIAHRLWLDPTLRAAIVEQSKLRVEKPPPPAFEYSDPNTPDPTPPTPAKQASAGLSVDEQALLGRLIGLGPSDSEPDVVGTVVRHVPGWILTALALMLGAPFWFDQLKKIMSVRATGRALTQAAKPEK